MQRHRTAARFLVRTVALGAMAVLSFGCGQLAPSSPADEAPISMLRARTYADRLAQLPAEELTDAEVQILRSWIAQGADLVVDHHLDAGRVELAVVERVPGQVDPAVGLVVEVLQAAGEDRIDGDALSRREDADDALSGNGAGLGGEGSFPYGGKVYPAGSSWSCTAIYLCEGTRGVRRRVRCRTFAPFTPGPRPPFCSHGTAG